ncbi:hypothetical protein DQ04_03701060 [Trypanosoma grayi]|uniref:hypothetical protein n=1 Tax=Trypanosoma grayi TaxID=71804 RepID=UPI0004F44556|nr:hypothetical protein DQ04_03701060 [Trypanosoma grayi]KEG10450.1 hypothetical protein DQ04_03701060 [Trypanosoma grayi]
MMRRSGVFLTALAMDVKSSFPTSSTATKSEQEKTVNEAAVTEELSAYTPSASEAPELLQPYVEPKPFVSAKRLQVFLASMGIGATTICVVYYLLSKSMSGNLEEEQRYVQRVVESNRLAMLDPQSLIPDFNAPSSFSELKEKMRQHEREIERKQKEVSRSTIMLHTEAVFRVKLWWNACLTHLQDAFDGLGSTIQKRKERAAIAHIKGVLDEEGYELVKLRNGKTHIW